MAQNLDYKIRPPKFCALCAYEELNLDPRLRRPVFYPLNYRRKTLAGIR